MPRIFDNIEQSLLPALQQALTVSDRADFAVGYFNLRGWKYLAHYIDDWQGGGDNCCRLLVGMQKQPEEQLRSLLSLVQRDEGMDQQTTVRLRWELAVQFRDQLTIGAPTDDDEAGLRRLAAQLRPKKLVVKLYLKTPLHAMQTFILCPKNLVPMWEDYFEALEQVYAAKAHKALAGA
jgi:hypothetical protein